MFINKITKEYPRFIGDLQLLYPDATLDNVPDDWALVEESPMPEYQSGEGIFETEPQQINGVWKQQWLVRDLTTEEITKTRTVISKPIMPISSFIIDHQTILGHKNHHHLLQVTL